LCSLKDALNHPPNKKHKAATSTLPKETASLSSLHEEIARHSEILGMYLGKRLHAKYCQVISSELQGQAGYAILDLVPDSPRWKKQQKKTLLSWFLLEIQPHLASLEAIKPTFSQVNMRKVEDTLMDGASPLTSSFLKQLNGQAAESLFPRHICQSYQLLQTSAGIPVPITNVDVDALRFQQGQTVLIKKKQTIKKKVSLVKEQFLECVPHLVSECTFLN
jgi:hypothetical protein